MTRRILMLLGVLAALAAIRWLRPRAATPLTAGETFPKQSAMDVNGVPIQWPQHAFFVVYTSHDSNMGIQAMKFIQEEQQETANMPFVITIIRGNKAEIAKFAEETGIKTPILRDTGSWSSRLGVGNLPFYLLLVTENSQIKFATDYVEPDDLRQVADKNSTGHVAYHDVNSVNPLRAGDRFAGFKVFDLVTESTKLFSAPAGGTVLCFTSRCPDCTLQEEIAEYAAYESQVTSQSPRTLLFSTRFSRTDLTQAAKGYGIKAQMLQAAESIPGVEDAFSFQTFVPSDIVRIDLTPGGTVKRIAPWRHIASGRPTALPAAEFFSDFPAPAVGAQLIFRSGSMIVDRAIQNDNEVFVVEANNHRIVDVDQQGKIQQQIGSIGQGPGELYYPGDLIRDKSGNLYVFEVRNRRIQVFDSSGHSIRTFEVRPQPYGMAVNSKGEILLGQPATGKLVSVYSSDGRYLRSFGKLRLASDFYGEKLRGRDKSMREAINRIHIACDGADNVYVSFLGAPFWRKYDRAGNLQFEKRIEFPEVDAAMTELSNFKARATVHFDEDNSPLPYITTGMAIDALQRLIFAVHWDKTWLAVTSADGTGGIVLPLQNPNLTIRNLSPANVTGLFALGAKLGHYNEVYYLTIPEIGLTTEKKEHAK